MSDIPIDDMNTREDSERTLSVDPSLTRNASRLSPGSTIGGRYRIDAYLAAGGMGQVYRAHDRVLGVPLALKTIHPKIAADPDALRRFKQELLLARSVSNPNVCRIFDIGHDAKMSVSFLTMEYLEGETLAARIRTNGPLPAEIALPLVREMADALDAAHLAGIVHRDFKSSNVMLVPSDDGERAVITDFGLAMTIADGEDVVRPGDMVGTPAFMSPEQVIGGAVGPASDLYALGVVLFEMCTGRVPFRGATRLETARAHLTLPPPRPSKLATVDGNWERTILTLLSKEPTKRYATAHDALLALEGRRNGKAAVRHSLPAERDAFVGRKIELDALASHLEGPDGAVMTRLLTIQGPGGTGKTRLARKYGWESLARWPGGVWFCDLSEARSTDGIAQAVSTALNVPLGKDDPIVQLGHAIAGRGKSLVILDNFEQVVTHADVTLGRWLERATETRFLVTTRERLQLPGETTHALEPLDPTTQAVELFEVRAHEHRPGFQLDASIRVQVEEIVRRLDGLPLAIELAASRLRMLSLEQLRDRLADRFKILAGGKPGRHATLSATLDWSWELLEPWEQSAIAQASVFEGGFTLDAAEAVIDLSAHDEAPLVLDVIQSLVDKSWLRTRVELGALRFEMYTTVQEYTSTKLHVSDAKTHVDSPAGLPSPAEVEARHGAYFGEMGTEESIATLDRHGGVARRAALHLELDNLVAACRRAVGRSDESTAAVAHVAASAVLELRGPFAASIRLGLDVLGTLEDLAPRARTLVALAGAEQLSGKMEEAREHYEAALTIHRELGNRRSEGHVLGNLGALHRGQGRMEEAREHHEAALAIHRELGDRSGEAVVLGDLGGFHVEQGRMEEAREHYEAALAIHREVGNRRSEGVVLGNLGALHRGQGRMEEAREHYEAALAIHRELGNRRGEGIVLGNLAVLHTTQGWMEGGREHYEAALAIHRELGSRRFEGIVLGNLGILHAEQGRVEEAREHFEAALAIHREVGNRRFEGAVLGNLGALHRGQGRMEEARERYQAALAIHRELGDRRGEGIVLGNLAVLHASQGWMEEAREHFEAALAAHREVGDRRFEGITLGNLGDVHAEQGRVEEACEHLEAALAVHREVGNRRFEGIVLGNLGALHAERSRMEEARRCFEESTSILRNVSDRLELGKVLCSLGEFEVQQGNLPAARAALAETESIAADLAVTPESELARTIEELRQSLANVK